MKLLLNCYNAKNADMICDQLIELGYEISGQKHGTWIRASTNDKSFEYLTTGKIKSDLVILDFKPELFINCVKQQLDQNQPNQ